MKTSVAVVFGFVPVTLVNELLDDCQAELVVLLPALATLRLGSREIGPMHADRFGRFRFDYGLYRAGFDLMTIF